MKHKARIILTTVTLLLFPVILNFLSPAVPIFGALAGVVTGSLLLFAAQLLTGLFLGRAWCGWLCPMAALSEICMRVNDRSVNRKFLRAVRLSVFGVWAAALIAGFIAAGGIKTVNPLFFTENGISVDEPSKYIVYYMVLALFLVVSLAVGRRGACHSFCWMSPFLAGGYALGKQLGVPQLRIKARPENCVDCGRCDKACPMSIPVRTSLKAGFISESDCVLCGECVKNCPKDVLRFGVK